MRFELTTWEEDELEFERCLQAARDKMALTTRDVGERKRLRDGFATLDADDE